MRSARCPASSEGNILTSQSRPGSKKKQRHEPLRSPTIIYPPPQKILQRTVLALFADSLAEEMLQHLHIFDHRLFPSRGGKVHTSTAAMATRQLSNAGLEQAKVLGRSVEGAGAVVVVVQDDLVEQLAFFG